MIIQSLGATRYLSLFYSLIAHSITLAHPGESCMQTTWRSTDDNKFIPKDQGRGVEDAAIRNNEMRL